MRTFALIVLILTLTAGCSSSGDTRAKRAPAKSPEIRGTNLKASDIKPVTEPTKVSWISFKKKNPRTGKAMTQQMSLVNRAHPEAKKPIPIERMQKVLKNEQMGLLLKLLENEKYFRHARAGLTADKVPAGRATGIIVVRRGNRVVGLPLERNLAGGSSEVPNVYIASKKLIFGIFNSADQPQVYTSDKDRALEIDGRLPGGVKR